MREVCAFLAVRASPDPGASASGRRMGTRSVNRRGHMAKRRLCVCRSNAPVSDARLGPRLLPAVICAGRQPKFALVFLCCDAVGLRDPYGLPFPAPFWAGHLCGNYQRSALMDVSRRCQNCSRRERKGPDGRDKGHNLQSAHVSSSFLSERIHGNDYHMKAGEDHVGYGTKRITIAARIADIDNVCLAVDSGSTGRG